jgi:hypothetical protein
MPRKSKDAIDLAAIAGGSLAVVAGSIDGRPEPPESLSLRQAETWRAVVSAQPVGWVTTSSYPVLIAYCEAVDGARRVEQILRAFTPKNPSSPNNVFRLSELLDMQRKQNGLVTTIATKLRLTPQSRYTPKAAATAQSKTGAGRKPWEVDPPAASR